MHTSGMNVSTEQQTMMNTPFSACGAILGEKKHFISERR